MPISDDIANMTPEELAAESARVAAQRADYERRRAEQTPPPVDDSVFTAGVAGTVPAPVPNTVQGVFMPPREAAPAPDNIAALEAQLEAARAAQAAQAAAPALPPAGAQESAPAEGDAPAAWPHETGVLAGRTLEIRKPSDGSLVALTLITNPALGTTVQLSLLGEFLAAHLSVVSYVEVLRLMFDPASGVEFATLIQFFSDTSTDPVPPAAPPA